MSRPGLLNDRIHNSWHQVGCSLPERLRGSPSEGSLGCCVLSCSSGQRRTPASLHRSVFARLPRPPSGADEGRERGAPPAPSGVRRHLGAMYCAPFFGCCLLSRTKCWRTLLLYSSSFKPSFPARVCSKRCRTLDRETRSETEVPRPRDCARSLSPCCTSPESSHESWLCFESAQDAEFSFASRQNLSRSAVSRSEAMQKTTTRNLRATTPRSDASAGARNADSRFCHRWFSASGPASGDTT
mmetsp:Transcript_35954/g.57270  ORF Transcript_35954/g.57270 Transcript_35954/m.57270 type:complete len:242 (-) Transcript_35954:3-728(-)